MYPTLIDGQLIILQSAVENPPRPGDVVLCRNEGAAPIIHRMICTEKDGRLVITQGDNCPKPDPLKWHISDIRSSLLAMKGPNGRWYSPRPSPGVMMVYAQRFRLAKFARFFFRLFPAAARKPIEKAQQLMAHDLTNNEFIVIDLSTDSRHTVNRTAWEIWRVVKNGMTAEQAIPQLKVYYPDIAEDQLRSDVLRTVDELRKLKLL
ncbi:MAG: PqqD family peptide modification chaperone [Candidatus Sumerlaeota bacterium]